MRKINSKQLPAFRELFERFYRYLLLYARKRLEFSEDAEDVVQDTFVSLWESTGEFSSFRALQAYLFKAVDNGCVNVSRRTRLMEGYALQVMHEGDEEAEREYALMREEVLRKVYVVLQELPENCRLVFLLYMEGKKNEEIAALLSLSVHTVKHNKMRAIQFLKERLGPFRYYLFLWSIWLS